MTAFIGRIQLIRDMVQLSLQFITTIAHLLPLLIEIILELSAKLSKALFNLIVLNDWLHLHCRRLLLEHTLGLLSAIQELLPFELPLTTRLSVQALVL